MTDNLQILSIDAVMAAMANYAEAQSEHDSARAKYDDYSWDWYGRRYINAVDSAKEAAGKILEQYIEACVTKALAKKYSSQSEWKSS